MLTVDFNENVGLYMIVQKRMVLFSH